jgi:hypothetical protein
MSRSQHDRAWLFKPALVLLTIIRDCKQLQTAQPATPTLLQNLDNIANREIINNEENRSHSHSPLCVDGDSGHL